MENFGSIMNARNICFKSTDGQQKYSVDHAFSTGRPVVVIAEDDEYMYFLSICGKNKSSEKYSYCVPMPIEYFSKESYVNIRDIYRKKICGFPEMSFISKKDMLYLMNKFLSYQSNVRKDELFDSILPLIKAEIHNDEAKCNRL